MDCRACIKKQKEIKRSFSSCQNKESIHLKMIDMGRALPPMPKKYQIEKNRIEGCQSNLYLHTECREGHLFFTAHSDALISLGIAAILLTIYNGESALVVAKCPPTLFKELGILQSLTPGRQNGLQSLYTRMQREAILSLTAYPH